MLDEWVKRVWLSGTKGCRGKIERGGGSGLGGRTSSFSTVDWSFVINTPPTYIYIYNNPNIRTINSCLKLLTYVFVYSKLIDSLKRKTKKNVAFLYICRHVMVFTKYVPFWNFPSHVTLLYFLVLNFAFPLLDVPF